MSKALAERVRQARERAHLTKSALGKKVGVTTTCVWNWEGGNTEPRPETLVKLAEALGVTPTFLRFGSSEQNVGTDKHAGSVDLALPGLITACRERIAAAAGLPLEQVRVVLNYEN